MDRPPELDKLYAGDPYLRTFESDILYRWQCFSKLDRGFAEHEGGLNEFAAGYKTRGLVQEANGDISLCEWVPNAESVSLVGDFNSWNESSHVCTRDDFGNFRLHLPAEGGKPVVPHMSKYKLRIQTKDGRTLWRLSPWAKYTVQFSEGADYEALHWAPQKPYSWQHPRPGKPRGVRIYEAHVGISSPEAKVASYTYFADSVLPRIKNLGYTCVELMAVMEHAYYGSFGYHVTSFFAASSRYGTPDELKYLVDKAHSLGLYVILDIVHSHAARNVNDGLNQFDGTDHCFFHSGEKGAHRMWDSRMFNYTKWEVLRFLLSNLRWYIDEYHIDGFRYDGITAMMYWHRGISEGFSGDYHEYFNTGVDVDALVYLMLANRMLHQLYPFVITVAEDVSGMPALCRPVAEGGIGFDYRLSMATPDMWIKLLKESRDDDWSMGFIWWTLTNRRVHEKCIAYAESHDQALVGDKTLSFWLMDAEMYVNMSTISERTVVIDRGLALHKMIRLITMALGGEAYLTFIGNEFGHPEWLDFPREGNGFSYYYARRQMNLVDDPLLRYQYLRDFDRDMQLLEENHGFLTAGRAFVSRKHDGDKLIVFERGGLLFVCNFHPSKSYTHYKVGVERPGKYRVALDTDSKTYDGYGRVDPSTDYFTSAEPWDGRDHALFLYVPARVALVFSRSD